MSLFDIFDAWEPLEKARKPKGLSKWSKLSYLANKLEGKHAEHITYTCCHPSHDELTVHNLGSVIGNLHFLQGYGNPGFHLADYHWQIIDPNLSDTDLKALKRVLGHPSKPALWRKYGKEVFKEGDVLEGKPHGGMASSRILDSSSSVKTVGKFRVIPELNLVYDGDKEYRWDYLKGTLIDYKNPELRKVMDHEDTAKSVFVRDVIPDAVACLPVAKRTYDAEVYPFVKSCFPEPGTIVPFSSKPDAEIYALLKSDRIEFYNGNAEPLTVSLFERDFKDLSLSREGDVNPSLILNFMKSFLGLDFSALSVPSHQQDDSWEAVPSYGPITDCDKQIIHEDGVYKLVLP